MAKLHVKKGDTVLVIAGKDKGKTGKITAAIPSQNAVVVEGVNFINKHKKPRNAQEKGGIIKLEGKINVSNVQLICPDCKKATRVSIKIDEKGKHVRVCKCGAVLDKATTIKKAKKADTKVAEAVKEAKPAKAKTTNDTKKAAPKSTAAATRKTSAATKTVVRKTGDKV